MVEVEHVNNPEVLDPNSVEVRFGDPKVDARQLLELYTDPTTREHIEGIVPLAYEEEYTLKDPDTGKQEFKKRTISATTVENIREDYRRNSNLTLLTAKDPSSGLIIVTCTVTKLSDNVAEIGKVVVHKDYRGKRIVDTVIKSANALMFREGFGGLDCKVAQAFVIFGSSGEDRIPGYHTALNAFGRQGYKVVGQRPEGSTKSWSNELGKLVDRSSFQLELSRKDYIQVFTGAHRRDFPK